MFTILSLSLSLSTSLNFSCTMVALWYIRNILYRWRQREISMSWLLHLFYRLVFTISFKRKKSKARTCTCWKSTKSGFRLRIEIYSEASNVPFFPIIYFHDTSQLPYQRKMHLDKIMRLSNGLKVRKWNIYFHTHHSRITSYLLTYFFAILPNIVMKIYWVRKTKKINE